MAAAAAAAASTITRTGLIPPPAVSAGTGAGLASGYGGADGWSGFTAAPEDTSEIVRPPFPSAVRLR